MIGIVVRHKLFGEGEIIQVADTTKPYEKYITVKFAIGEKKFIFPSIFESILTTQNDDLKQKIREALELVEIEKQKVRELEIAKREAERERLQAISSMKKTHIEAPKSYSIDGKLIKGKIYGTNAKKIFLACCDELGWNDIEQKHFGWQTPNYSEIATPEGYSVWFLAHSDWTGTDITEIKNKVSYSTIEQWWTDEFHLKATQRKRVVFAKKDNYYQFLGIFKIADFERTETQYGKTYYIETFNLTSENYPECKVSHEKTLGKDYQCV